MSWELEYKNRLRTPEEALHQVQSGMRVYVQANSGEPESLVEALLKRAPFVNDVELVHCLAFGRAGYVAPEMAGHFRHNALFIGSNVREAVNDGRADYTPVYLSEVEELFESGTMPLDVALIQVSPPDAHGFCSFGVCVEIALTASKCAHYVVAQVNDQMPRTYGDCFIHVSQMHAIVESSRPLCELPKPNITDLHMAVARNVAGLIDDGAVVQTGIGAIPNAVLSCLMDRKDLGVHTELVSDSMIPLIEAGVITGARKNLHPRRIILAFAVGTKKLFDYVDENPIFEFHPNRYANDPHVIACNDNMVAINSALQIDLTGQVCADSIGTYFYSGIGGQVDFLRGASRSKGGKPIVALPSTAKNDTISRIVPTLDPGAGVVTSRGLIRYVVTEYGVAYLHGKTIRERAKALIEIAHPKFRDELYEYCERTKWLHHPKSRSHAGWAVENQSHKGGKVMENEALSIVDKRTKKTYEIPIYKGTVRAMDLRQIKTGPEDFGLMSYDPAFMNTASCQSTITFIDGDKGILRYRGYPIEQLAEKCTFLEVAYLVLFGELPTATELKDWVENITHHTMIHETTKKFLEGFRYDAHPMGMFVSTVAALSTVYPEARNVLNPETRKLQIYRLIGKVPTIAAYTYRHSLGYPYVYPDNDLSYTENFMNMLWKMVEPKYQANSVLARALDILFILHADHEQNCSANAMRAVGSSQADPFMATAAAAAALSGPLHGGANEEVLKMLDEIGSTDHIPAYIERVKAGQVKLMGFGHRIYKNYDPRARIIKWAADQVFQVTGRNRRLDIALELERIALQDDYFIKRKLYPNVDFYSGIIYQAMGFKPEMFTVLFAIPRTAGWLAQWQEMLCDSEQKIARPRQIFTGHDVRDFVPIDKRGIKESPAVA